MLPITLLAASKLANLLTTGSALQNAVSELAAANNTKVPAIAAAQILLSSASADLADSVNQSTYPRICLYSGALRNTHKEKFRRLSGSVSVIAEIWGSGNFVNDSDNWIHFYVDAFTSVIQDNVGDWGDGLYFPGTFDVAFQTPKRGGVGFTQMARISCEFLISRD